MRSLRAALRRLFVVKTTLRHSPLLPDPVCLPELEHLHLHLALANVDPLVARSMLTTDALPKLTALARFALGTSATEAALVSSLSSLSLSKAPPPTLDCPKLQLWDYQAPLPAPPPEGVATASLFAPPSVRIVRFSRPNLDLATVPAYLTHFPEVEEVHVRNAASPADHGLEALRRWATERRAGEVKVCLEPDVDTPMESLFNPQFWELVERVEGWVMRE